MPDQPQAPAKRPTRYAIKGRRPGEIYHGHFGTVETNSIDGGAVLTDKQKAYFEKEYGIVAVADVAPRPKPAELTADQKRRIAENANVAAALENEALRVRVAELANQPPT